RRAKPTASTTLRSSPPDSSLRWLATPASHEAFIRRTSPAVLTHPILFATSYSPSVRPDGEAIRTPTTCPLAFRWQLFANRLNNTGSSDLRLGNTLQWRPYLGIGFGG